MGSKTAGVMWEKGTATAGENRVVLNPTLPGIPSLTL